MEVLRNIEYNTKINSGATLIDGFSAVCENINVFEARLCILLNQCYNLYLIILGKIISVRVITIYLFIYFLNMLI